MMVLASPSGSLLLAVLLLLVVSTQDTAGIGGTLRTAILDLDLSLQSALPDIRAPDARDRAPGGANAVMYWQVRGDKIGIAGGHGHGAYTAG